MNDRNTIGADDLPEGLTNGLDEGGFISRRSAIKGFPDKVGEDFGVRLGVENMSALDQLVAQDLIILYDSIVDEMESTRFVRMGVCIFAGDRTMCGPAGVADADRARNGVFFDFFG